MPRVLLEVTSGPTGVGRAFAGPGEVIRLGRDALCDLVFPLDTTVSREHCSVVITDGDITLTDSSSYGTKVNGNQVTRTKLADGDLIEFGQGIVVAVFVDPDEESAAESLQTVEDASIAYLGPTESLSALSRTTVEFANTDVPIAWQVEFLPPERSGKILKFPLAKSILVGRLPSCDLYISDDPAVSRHHCRIEYESGELQLENLGTHGCRINREQIEKRAVIQDGDKIEIGISTAFRISLIYPGAGLEDGQSFDADASLVLQREDASNGLSICRIDVPKDGSLLTVLAELCPEHHPLMILDRVKSGVECENSIEVDQYLLCERYPENVLPQISPILPSPEEWTKPEFMEDINGSDAFLIVMTKPSADLGDVVTHLRRLSDLNPSTGMYSQGQTLFAFWWPSMLSNVCRNCPEKTASELFSTIDVIACEADDGAAIELISQSDFANQLASLEGVHVEKIRRSNS